MSNTSQIREHQSDSEAYRRPTVSDVTRNDLWVNLWPDDYGAEGFRSLSDAEFDAIARDWLFERLGVDVDELREAVERIEQSRYDGLTTADVRLMYDRLGGSAGRPRREGDVMGDREKILPLPEHARLTVFLAGQLAQRDRRWWRRVSWTDRLHEANEMMGEWHTMNAVGEES